MQVGLALLAGLAAVAPSTVLAEVVHTVAMDGTRFLPESITVRRGERIVWLNKDPFPHTATAPGTFDSKPVAAGESWSYVARHAGEFEYVCTLHPGMKARLIVR
ncbi:MAG: cupredoxin domain-containing protein [Casimicrobiaceae bacterium]